MVLVVGVMLLAARAAAAQGAVETQLECTAGKRAIAADKPNLIDNHLVCAVRVTGELPKGATASVALVQDGKPEVTRDSARPIVDGDDRLFKLDPFVRISEFRPCNDFTLRVTVGDATSEHAIATRCRKPKKLKAKLTCEHYALDGAGPFAYPGKGKRPRLDSTLTCWIRAGKGKAADGAVATVTAAGEPWVEPLYVDDDTRQWTAGAVLEPDQDFTPCEPLTVKASVTSALGQIVWSGKLAIPQACD
jgi:hypothetical protein